MPDKTDAWVWSQYKSDISENKRPPTRQETRSHREENVVPLGAGLEPSQGRSPKQPAQRRMKYGIALSVATVVGLFFPTFAILLVLLATFLVLSGREPKKVGNFLATLPAGGHLIKALEQIDDWLA